MDLWRDYSQLQIPVISIYSSRACVCVIKSKLNVVCVFVVIN